MELHTIGIDLGKTVFPSCSSNNHNPLRAPIGLPRNLAISLLVGAHFPDMAKWHLLA
jgi:hypothetical protein